MVRFLTAALIGLALVCGFAKPARAGATELDGPPHIAATDARATAEATYETAAKDDDALHFAAALAGYRRSIAILPSHRYAQRAQTRIDFLSGHAEGDFAPLAALEAVRRTPGATKDGARVDALVAAAAEFPPGAVRGESYFVAGEAYLTELHRPADANAAFRKTLDETAASPLLRKQAAARLIDFALASGDLADARRLAVLADDHALAQRVAVAERRHQLHLASMVALAAFAAFAVLAIARRRQGLFAVRGFAPWALLLVAYVAGAGGLLATTFESGNALPFLAFGAILLPLVLLARAWGTAGRTTAMARVGRALVSASAVLAAAFLLLERIDVRYLEGFGL
ncbi:hypothetical protein BH09MYX1_BH09MYX1_31180 [soil metagenome]